MKFYKDRVIEAGTKVKAYFNLHKKVFSIVAMEGEHKGKVVVHSPSVILSNVSFQVNEGGRQRVLRERRKNVHAYVVGTFVGGFDQNGSDKLLETLSGQSDLGSWVSYNPYKKDHFYYVNSGHKIDGASYAFLVNKKVKVVA